MRRCALTGMVVKRERNRSRRTMGGLPGTGRPGGVLPTHHTGPGPSDVRDS